MKITDIDVKYTLLLIMCKYSMLCISDVAIAVCPLFIFNVKLKH